MANPELPVVNHFPFFLFVFVCVVPPHPRRLHSACPSLKVTSTPVPQTSGSFCVMCLCSNPTCLCFKHGSCYLVVAARAATRRADRNSSLLR